MSNANMVHCQLWMGGLEPYMTESFILASFQRMGEKPLNVKVMRNKFTGEPAGYCFVHFENDDEAIDAMHKLNGKVIPNTNPPVRFRLNTASNQGKVLMNEREFSLWVGDLSPEVDDYTLYKTFAARYQSIKAAKVILDASGFSKGFGFLRFGSEDEQKHCLTHMNGYKGLGTKALKISNAIPKAQRTNPPGTTSLDFSQPTASTPGGYPTQDYSHYYDPSAYWQNYSGWGSYYDNTAQHAYNYVVPTHDASQYAQPQPHQPDTSLELVATPAVFPGVAHPSLRDGPKGFSIPCMILYPPSYHGKPAGVDVDNEEAVECAFYLWDITEACKWTSPETFEAEMTKLRYLTVES